MPKDKELDSIISKEMEKYKEISSLRHPSKPSDGFFIAKRQMQETLDYKIVELRSMIRKLKQEGKYADASIVSLEADFVEWFRDYVRNGMLWDKSKGD